MSKFKVGDKVRCVEPGGWYYLEKGKVYEVKGIVDNRVAVFSFVGFGEDHNWFDADRFELVSETPKPHVHAELIKQWADNPKLELQAKYTPDGTWHNLSGMPPWLTSTEYRIKPKEPKPDVVRYMQVEQSYVSQHAVDDSNKYTYDNLKLTFDAETGKLKSAEVI